MNGRLIRIRPYGRLGNQMFQLMLAEAIRRRVPGARVAGHHLPDWDLSVADRDPPGSVSIRIRGHMVPLEEIAAFVRSVEHVDVVIETLSCWYGLYRDDLLAFRSLFPRADPVERIGPGELAINVRLGEILDGRHPSYMPLPIVWYERLVAETGLRPVLVGQIGDDRYSQALLARFPGARVIAGLPPRQAFEVLRSAENVAIAISTFSWLAAWLSESARTIHMPVAGLYHPLAEPTRDLLPLSDARFRFYDTPLEAWAGEPRQLDALISGDIPTPEISHEALGARAADLIGPAGLARGGPALSGGV